MRYRKPLSSLPRFPIIRRYVNSGEVANLAGAKLSPCARSSTGGVQAVLEVW